MMYKAYCPKCKFTLYSTTRSRGAKAPIKFKCTCGCQFTLKEEFVMKN